MGTTTITPLPPMIPTITPAPLPMASMMAGSMREHAMRDEIYSRRVLRDLFFGGGGDPLKTGSEIRARNPCSVSTGCARPESGVQGDPRGKTSAGWG